MSCRWASWAQADAHWVRAALDADTRQVVTMAAGDRSEATAQSLRDAPAGGGPAVRAEFWAATAAVVPAARLVPGGQGAGGRAM